MRPWRAAAVSVILPVVAAVAVLGASVPTARAGSGVGGSGSAVVRTSDGLIRGVVSANYRTFSGIPYAAAPVGELRWRPPRPESPWRGIRNATKPGGSLRAMVNMPVVSGALALRVSGYGSYTPGYVDNLYSGETGINVLRQYGK